jgi:hypothetical protein
MQAWYCRADIPALRSLWQEEQGEVIPEYIGTSEKTVAHSEDSVKKKQTKRTKNK